MSEKQQPVFTAREGALSVSVWKRFHNDQPFYNATPQRAYLDEKDTSGGQDGTWKYSDSFSASDLPVMASLLNIAFAWIVRTKAAERDSSK